MVLHSVESNPILLLRFTPKAKRDLIQLTIGRLAQAGIVVVVSEGYKDGDAAADKPVLGLTTSQDLLENEAELVKMVKPSRTQNKQIPIIMEHFTVNSRLEFINIKESDICFNEDLAKNLPKIDRSDYDSEGLFTSADRALLMNSMLNSLPVLAQDEEASDFSKHLDSLNVVYCDGTVQRHCKSVVNVLKHHGFVDVICPVHSTYLKEKILRETSSLTTAMPIQMIQSYYGEGVAFHFAWQDFMTKWFMIPGLLGLAVYFIRKARGDTVDNCDFTPFFGLATFFWAILCDRCWERNESRLAFLWGTYASSYRDRVSFGQRPEFVGEMRKSPVTGRIEKFYSPRKRLLKFAVSALVTGVLLAGASFVMVIGMNLQGYITSEDLEQWGEVKHPLYYPFFARLAEPGNIFDATSTFKSLIPVILRALFVMNLNNQYRGVAEKLTEWENHETTADFNNSLICKRVLFEAFDAYIVLFYLTICERNINLVRLELVGAFNVDTFRRVLIECIIPWLVQKKASKVGKDKENDAKKNDDAKAPDIDSLTHQANLDDYEQFDDYLEMIVQFGYVTLFASAFPLAAFIAVGANLVEYRADIWKLTRLIKRPSPERLNGIGMWKRILRVMVWLSAITNCLIFAFTSSQMRQWLPDNYTTDEYGRTVLVPHTADETVLIVFGIEHVIILLGLTIRLFIDPVPDDVLDEVDRCKWFHETLAQKSRMRMMTKVQNTRHLIDGEAAIKE